MLLRQAGDVAARSRQVHNEAGADRVSRRHEDDRDDRRRLLGGNNWCAPPCHNDVELEPDEFGGDLGEALFGTFRPAVLDCDGAALDPAKLTQPLQKSGYPLSLGRTRARAQEPNRLRRLLPLHGERPCCGRAAEQRDELAAGAHSITSSAVDSSDGGTVRPSIRAGWRLMTNSNFDDCVTGKSAGFAPLRMRPT